IGIGQQRRRTGGAGGAGTVERLILVLPLRQRRVARHRAAVVAHDVRVLLRDIGRGGPDLVGVFTGLLDAVGELGTGRGGGLGLAAPCADVDAPAAYIRDVAIHSKVDAETVVGPSVEYHSAGCGRVFLELVPGDGEILETAAAG